MRGSWLPLRVDARVDGFKTSYSFSQGAGGDVLDPSAAEADAEITPTEVGQRHPSDHPVHERFVVTVQGIDRGQSDEYPSAPAHGIECAREHGTVSRLRLDEQHR